MENQFITYLKVENFKKFTSLEVNDIGKFNLIVGDNNVGKTCLLEALLVDEDSYDRAIELLHYSLCLRNHHFHAISTNSKNPIIPNNNYFNALKKQLNSNIKFYWKKSKQDFKKFYFEDIELKNLSEVDFSKEKKHNYNVGRPNWWIKIYENDEFKELQFMYFDDFFTNKIHGYLPFIKMGQGFDRDLNHFYAQNIGLDRNSSLSFDSEDDIGIFNYKLVKKLSFEDKQNFISNLSLIFKEEIEDIAIKNFEEREILGIKLKSSLDYVPITYFGDGTNIFIRYILEIPRNRGKRLMIDEFGEGIHFSKLKEFCEIIIEVSKIEKVQLFATTHSKECIEAYTEAINKLTLEEKLNKNDGKLINLVSYGDEVKAYTFDATKIDIDYEYR